VVAKKNVPRVFPSKMERTKERVMCEKEGKTTLLSKEQKDK
jgi:hypothetical protein